MADVALGRYLDTWYRCERDSARELGCATYVVGVQGMGKSTLLANLAEQFVAAGEGVVVIDTRGELAEDIAARTRHTDRLVYVAPGEYAFPTGNRFWALNPLEFDRSQPHLESIAVSNLLALIDRMDLADLKRMPQLRQILSMTAQLALALPQPTLLDLLDILGRPALRSKLLAEERFRGNLAVRRFWDGYNELTPKQQWEKAASTLPRLNEFLTDEVVRHLVSHPRSTVRLAEWLDRGQLVVCNLGSRLGSEVRRLLGNFVVASLVNATYARRTVNQGPGRPWRVIVDEFHELAGDQFAEIIEQGRKYRVFPVVAHQNLSQLSERLTNAVVSCQLRGFLRVSSEDQGTIRRLFGAETSEGLTQLPRFQARVHFNDGPEGRVRVETLQLPGWWAERDEAQLHRARVAAAVDRFTIPETAIDPATAVTVPPPPAASATAVLTTSEGPSHERCDPADLIAGEPEEAAALPTRPEPEAGTIPLKHIPQGLAILEACDQRALLTNGQLSRLFFEGKPNAHGEFRALAAAEKAAAKVLQRLWEGGWVERRQVILTSKRTGGAYHHFVNVLTPRGAQVVGQLYQDRGRGELRWKRPGVEISHQTIEHTLAINDVYVLAKRASECRDVAFFSWKDDRQLAAMTRAKQLHLVSIPDAFFVLGQARRGVGHFLEIDLGTESVAGERSTRIWREKIDGYGRYFRERYGDEAYFEGVEAPVVLTVTTSPRRVDHMLQVTREIGGADRFWYTTLDALTPERIVPRAGGPAVAVFDPQPFWQLIWHVATDPTPRSLLTRLTGETPR